MQAEEAAARKVRAEVERARLARERAVLAQQSRALLKLPSKKERAEVGFQGFRVLCTPPVTKIKIILAALL
jgi:hypothetical protein